MHIGRRKFLKFAGIAAASAAIDPLSAFIESNNYFVSRRLGFGFIVPEAWEVEAFTSFKETRDKQIISDLDGYSRKELLLELSDGLVAAVRKYPDTPKPRFSPAVTFFMAPNEKLNEHDGLGDLVNQAIKSFKMMLRDYEVFETPEISKGKNFEAYRFKARYIFEHEDIKPILIDDETLVVDHNDILYSIHLYDSPYENEICTSELAAFKDSLHIA